MTLTSIGLALDIVGVMLLFFYGPPPGILGKEPQGTFFSLGISDEETEWRRIRRHLVMSKAALVLIVIGFGLQFWDSVCR